jgi:uncharacterized membrane protein YqjE
METSPQTTGGFMGTLRVLGDSLMAIVHDRLDLFSLELQEEKFRLIRTFCWISAALFTAMMTVMLASLTLVYLFWESARLAVLGGLTLLYAAALVVIIVGFRRYLARLPRPFSATLDELTEDRACIRKPT